MNPKRLYLEEEVVHTTRGVDCSQEEVIQMTEIEDFEANPGANLKTDTDKKTLEERVGENAIPVLRALHTTERETTPQSEHSTVRNSAWIPRKVSLNKKLSTLLFLTAGVQNLLWVNHGLKLEKIV